MAATKKLAALESALNQQRLRGDHAPLTRAEPRTDQPSRAPSRQGKEHVGGWLDPSYKASLLLIQAKLKGQGVTKSAQALFAEALNDLFAKYDVPVISE
jgi:hypothetical protein